MLWCMIHDVMIAYFRSYLSEMFLPGSSPEFEVLTESASIRPGNACIFPEPQGSHGICRFYIRSFYLFLILPLL